MVPRHEQNLHTSLPMQSLKMQMNDIEHLNVDSIFNDLLIIVPGTYSFIG